jgi:sarcosine oxidase
MATHHIAADVAVIGLGAMGSATLLQLAKRGVHVVGIDRFDPPHNFGSSHGETRITRQAIGEGDIYVPLALRSHAIWDELEAETGERLIERCGFVAMASHDEAMVHHGKTGFVEATIAAARRHGTAHEVLSAAEVRYRFPQFIGLEGNERCYFEPGGGYVRPERCISAQLRLAARAGAQLLLNTKVVSVEVEQGGVRITTATDTIVAGQAVIAAGAWIKPFVPATATRHMGVYRQVAHWLPITDPAKFRGDAPVFIWHHGPASDDQIYGFPPVDGADEIKCAGETYAHPTEPDADWSFVAPAEADAFVRTHVAPRISGVASRVARSSACLYTVVDDGDFLIDRAAPDSPITLVSACSGHGFKHSSAIGETVARSLVSPGSQGLPAPFRLGRFSDHLSK